MKLYKDKITLNKNNRGCYILDTIKGCQLVKNKVNGCYNNCYAENIASRYGFDFSTTVKRDFKRDTEQLYLFGFCDTRHSDRMVRDIKNIDMPFVRIGEMGDPSWDWNHTIDICKIISEAGKPIVIITKHFKTISKKLLKEISKLNIIINTSVSALDDCFEIDYRLDQYNILKDYCKSVLRIVSCDFNKRNKEGKLRSGVQDILFDNDNVIDTIFRPKLKNALVTNNVIKIEKVKFLKSNIWASVFNKNTYLGLCYSCLDMCGINS